MYCTISGTGLCLSLAVISHKNPRGCWEPLTRQHDQRGKKETAPARNGKRVKEHTDCHKAGGSGFSPHHFTGFKWMLLERGDEHTNRCGELSDTKQSSWICKACRVPDALRTSTGNKPLCQGMVPKITPKFGDSLGLPGKIYYNKRMQSEKR